MPRSSRDFTVAIAICGVGPMGDVVKFKKPKLAEKHRGKGLCKSGHHKWQVEKAQQFDVKQGRLVTLFRCERCGKTRTRAL